jgi:FkbM family methyltransferase
VVTPTLFGRQDVYTLNEIFCRLDYGRGGQRVVVDIGANIGLASLFFLTRRADAVVYGVEPVPRNIERLSANLADYSSRFRLETRAVAPSGGKAKFFVEDTGRLGGLREFSSREGGQEIIVECLPIAEYLQAVLDAEGHIDVVKVDTEGSERPLIAAIPENLRQHIGEIVWENNDGTTRWM